MTKKDFFTIIIKLFGLSSIVTTLFAYIPSQLSYALIQPDILSLIWITITVIIVIALFILLVFYADKVVTFLHLDQGYDEDRIELGNLNTEGIAKLAIILISGYLILESIPAFFSHTLIAFKEDIGGNRYDIISSFNWAVSAINLVLGFMMLTNYKAVIKLLKLQDNNEEK